MAERSMSELRADMCAKDICDCLQAANQDVAGIRKNRLGCESKAIKNLAEVRDAVESDLKRQVRDHTQWEEEHKKEVADELTGFVVTTEGQMTDRYNDFAMLDRKITDEVRRLKQMLTQQNEARGLLEH